MRLLRESNNIIKIITSIILIAFVTHNFNIYNLIFIISINEVFYDNNMAVDTGGAIPLGVGLLKVKALVLYLILLLIMWLAKLPVKWKLPIWQS